MAGITPFALAGVSGLVATKNQRRNHTGYLHVNVYVWLIPPVKEEPWMDSLTHFAPPSQDKVSCVLPAPVSSGAGMALVANVGAEIYLG